MIVSEVMPPPPDHHDDPTTQHETCSFWAPVPDRCLEYPAGPPSRRAWLLINILLP